MAWTETLASGRYRGVYRLPDGKKRSVGTFDHEERAKLEAERAEEEAALPNWRDPQAANISWSKWCAAWWPTRAVEPSTLLRDESRRKKLEAKWGDRALGSITRHEVKEWAGEMRTAGLSPATVQRYLSLLSSSFVGAVDAEILIANPAARLKLPVPQNSAERYLSRDEAGDLLAEFAEGSIERAMVAFLLGCGVRWGEAAGARIEQLDVKAKTYRVWLTWDDANNAVKDYPKGRRRRTVPVPAWVMRELKPLAKGRKSGFLFDNGGVPLDYHNFRNRVWTAATKRAKLVPFNIHACRHTYASWLIQDGIPLEEVGLLLGHISPLTTRRYAHLIEADSTAVLASLTDPTKGTIKKGSAIKKGSERGANVGQTAPHSASNVVSFAQAASRRKGL